MKTTKLVIVLLLSTFQILSLNCFSQEMNSISEPLRSQEFTEGDTTRNYTLGEEGSYVVRLEAEPGAVYVNENQNGLSWLRVFEKKARVRITPSGDSLIILKIANKKERLGSIKGTSSHLKGGIVQSTKLSKKNMVSYKRGDTTYYSIVMPKSDRSFIVDYAYSTTLEFETAHEGYGVPRGGDKNLELLWVFDNRTPTKYSKVIFSIPEYFTADRVLDKISDGELETKSDDYQKSVAVFKSQRDEGKTLGVRTTLAFSENSYTYTLTGKGVMPRLSSIKYTLRQFKKIYLN